MAARSRTPWLTTVLLTALLCAALTSSGCSLVRNAIQDRITDKIEDVFKEQGVDADIAVTIGPSCLPDWVTHPAEEAANQGWRSPEGQVCVSSWPEIADSTDLTQPLPVALDDAGIAMIVRMMLPLMAGEIPGGVGGLLAGAGEDYLADLEEQFAELGMKFAVFGDSDRLLIALTGTEGADPGMMSLSMGAFCTGAC